MGNASALPVIPDVNPRRLRAGKGIVLGCRVPEESREIAVAFQAYCAKNNLKASRVMLAAVAEYLKNHGGAR
jgi:hypothetical protein